jgi:hypothetical protein
VYVSEAGLCRSRVDPRRGQALLRETEEARAVDDVQDVAVEERVQLRVEAWVVEVVRGHEPEERIEREQAGRAARVDGRADPVRDEHGAREVREHEPVEDRERAGGECRGCEAREEREPAAREDSAMRA